MAAIIGAGGQSRYRLAQEREFFRFLPREELASHFAPWDDASNNAFIPQPSKDPALTSYAQSSATRLGAERALISLFDRTQQHVVAEATPTLSLLGGHVANEVERLRLGCCVFPKERGLCRLVETTPSSKNSGKDAEVDDRAVVVLDMAKDERFRLEKVLAPLSDAHFFVAIPIVSPRGFIIGALSVMDSKPRSTHPDQHSLQFLKDMAATIMEHLEMKQATHQIRRAERMIVGLGSFVEGRSTLRDSWEEAKAEQDASEQSGEQTEGQLNIEQQDMQQLAKESGETGQKGLVIREPPRKTTDTEGAGEMKSAQNANSSQQSTCSDRKQKRDSQRGFELSQNDRSVRSVLEGGSLQDHTLPTSIRNICSRAANLLRESIGAEGVMFLDANSEQFGNLVNQNVRRVSDSGMQETTSSGGESTDSASSTHRKPSDAEQSSDNDEHPRFSECLGFSSSRVSSINDEDRAGQAIVVPEPLFSSLIRRYPRGKIFTYNANGSLSEDSDDPTRNNMSGSDLDDPSRGNERRASGRRRRIPTSRKDADDLIKIFAGARNILVLPIWDSDRKRWFAGVLAWTNEPDRIFTFENELVYMSAFSNSIMAEIRRVDVEVAEKAKTNLVSSITHELRNPLHGILGTADILSDTAMNALQHGMVHTIESCGRTLLDTINNLLDLTFIDQYRKGNTAQAAKRGKRKPGVPRSLTANQKSSYSLVKLDSVLEEVTECVFAGYCFYNHPQAPPPALTDSSSRSAGQTNKAEPVGPRASQVTVIFDIEPNTEWDFYTHPGAWRRILMNIFGNALKYTSSGYIYLGLKSGQRDSKSSGKSSKKESDYFNVTLTVKDTGKGIGAEYLQNDLFSPFSQEDPMASGSGLGLSIVRQAVGFLGGSIEIESTKDVGTQLSIHTPLIKSSTASETSSSNSAFNTLKRHTEDKTIGLLGFGEALRSQRDTSLYSSLERMCRDWFGLKVSKVSPSEGSHVPLDFYLAVQTELDCEDVAGRDLFGLPRRLEKEGTWDTPVVVICQSPEEAHRMFVAAKTRGDTTFFEFVSQPCGPRKLARALDMCIKRRRDHESGRRSSDEPTRWVEMPESSHLPMDVGPSDPPEDRMKISKRPTADTLGEGREEYRYQSPQGTSEDPSRDPPAAKQEIIDQTISPSKQGEGESQTRQPSVLLVDDNDLNLQMLCAYAKKEGLEYMTGKNGAEAVDIYKAHPGQFQVIIIDMSMPVMDGFEASRQIRRLEKEHRASLSGSEQKELPSTIIAALTGLDSAEAQKEALGSGINTFLIKPIKRSEVQAILRRQV